MDAGQPEAAPEGVEAFPSLKTSPAAVEKTPCELTELGPTDYRVVMNETGASRWVTAGLHEAGLAMAGAKEPRVVVESSTDTHATYRLTWR